MGISFAASQILRTFVARKHKISLKNDELLGNKIENGTLLDGGLRDDDERCNKCLRFRYL